eukprot:6076134-Amphidinium_carterae.1
MPQLNMLHNMFSNKRSVCVCVTVCVCVAWRNHSTPASNMAQTLWASLGIQTAGLHINNGMEHHPSRTHLNEEAHEFLTTC